MRRKHDDYVDLSDRIKEQTDEEEDDLLTDSIRQHRKRQTDKQRSEKKFRGRNRQSFDTKAAARPRNREFAIVTYSFLVLFIALSIYFCYYMVFKSEDFINNSRNARLSQMSDSVIRGDIITSDGEVIATTKVASDGTETREYPYGAEYAHVAGYTVNGMSGLEKDSNFQLLRSHSFILTRIINDLKDEKSQGDSVVTTIDSRLQDTVYKGMGSYQGAVIAMDPETGKILAMVSKPDFDPNTVASNWDSLSESDSSVLVNRATQGLYPPGSTFKIVTALAYLRNGGKTSDTFTCNGSITEGGYTLHCYDGEVHGTQNFQQAFAHSCNVAFATAGLSLGKNDLKNTAQSLLFNKDLPTALSNVNKSSFTMKSDADKAEIMQTSIGQGSTLVTPINMLMIVSAIANKGELMEPYYIDHTENDAGNLVRTFHATSYGELITAKEARTLRKYMRSVVTEGTGTRLNVSNYKAYGKTGTAEYSSDGSSHSWFVGYAVKDGKKIAVAVIMEGAGTGSTYAVPLAGQMFDTYFE